MTEGSGRPTFRDVHFVNYKAFKDFRIRLRSMNVLVGPNNAGKSTVIGAFRILAGALRTARSRNPERFRHLAHLMYGWRLSESSMPISIENVHRDYEEADATVTFTLSNGNRLDLLFPAGSRDAYLVPHATDRVVASPATFRRSFPVTLGVVPVLGAVEHHEELVEREYVRRHLTSPRASRHFRSYWYLFPEDFDMFRSRVKETWPGMDVQLPEKADPLDKRLMMLCLEEGFPRELFWSGTGFQVWCQTLTHLIRAEQTDLVVIDEPEVYLHPDLQRQLLGILRELGPDVLLATHSAEILGECERFEVVNIDKSRRTAERVSSAAGMQAALVRLGSAQNLVLSRLARTARVIFVEGEEFKYLAAFARRLHYPELASQSRITVASLGHFPHTANEILDLLRGMEEALGKTVLATCLFDRDYRTDEDVQAFEDALAKKLHKPHLTRRKEIENYLLHSGAIDRAVDRSRAEHVARGGKSAPTPPSARALLDELSESYRHETQGQYVGHRIRRDRPKGIDEATVTAAATRQFEQEWASFDSRIRLMPGKDVLGALLARYQTDFGINVTPLEIIRAFDARDIDYELRNLLRDWDEFRQKTPTAQLSVD